MSPTDHMRERGYESVDLEALTMCARAEGMSGMSGPWAQLKLFARNRKIEPEMSNSSSDWGKKKKKKKKEREREVGVACSR